MDENNKDINKEDLENLEKQEAELKETLEQVSETNKKIDDAYDEKMKRLEEKKRLLPNKKEEEAREIENVKIATLKEKLNEIKSRISEARKKGKDPFIADLWLRNVNSKIKMAEVTNDQKDYQIVENILNNAKLELEDTLKQEEINVKKEIETKLRQNITKETGKVIDEEEY